MVDIKNKITDVTVGELRTEIYQKASGKNRKIKNNFSKNQLFEIAKEMGLIEGSKCYFCGEKDSSCLETHHIIPQSMGGPDYQENLVKLCANCHRKIEDLYDPIKLNTIVEDIEETKQHLPRPKMPRGLE